MYKWEKIRILALKCTFLGQNKVNIQNSLHMRKKNFHVFYTWYKSLVEAFISVCSPFFGEKKWTIFWQISHSAEGAEGDDDYRSHASTKMFHPGQLTSTLL